MRIEGPAFSDTALVLLGHGSTLNAESCAPVYQHAATLRGRGIFTKISEAFWKQSPNIKDVLDATRERRVFIIPLFISEGYFSEQVIPRELGLRTEGASFTRVRQEGERTLYYGKAVGTHDRMTEVLLARAKAVVERFPFPVAPRASETTLLIAGHGTTQNDDSREAIDRQVELIRKMNLYAAVQGVFLEETPGIAQCYDLAPTRSMVIVPFFISDGLHTREDIPILLGEPKRFVKERLVQGQPTWRNPTERKGKRVWYSASVGTDPLVAEVILERVREAENFG